MHYSFQRDLQDFLLIINYQLQINHHYSYNYFLKVRKAILKLIFKEKIEYNFKINFILIITAILPLQLSFNFINYSIIYEIKILYIIPIHFLFNLKSSF